MIAALPYGASTTGGVRVLTPPCARDGRRARTHRRARCGRAGAAAVLVEDRGRGDQPKFTFADAIEEVVFVETTLDTNGDGARDRIRIRISRPAETAGRQGIDVPVIFEHSPYRGEFGEAVNHNVDFAFMPQERIGRRRAAAARARGRSRADLPGQLVPRGYAVVPGESIGTHNSDGCPDVGGPWETLDTKAVIDWLNGRARGFDAAGNPVGADWTTGAVA